MSSVSTVAPSQLPPRSMKVCIIGDSGVGKTSLRQRGLHDTFSANYIATLGADFLTKTVPYRGETLRISVWDTAGQERYQSLSSAFYRGSDACILVYDASNAASIQSLRKWYKDFVHKCPVDANDIREFTWVCVGNKIDLVAQAKPSFYEKVESLLDDLIPRVEHEHYKNLSEESLVLNQSCSERGSSSADTIRARPNTFDLNREHEHIIHKTSLELLHEPNAHIEAPSKTPEAISIEQHPASSPSITPSMMTGMSSYHTPAASISDSVLSDFSENTVTPGIETIEDDSQLYANNSQRPAEELERDRQNGIDPFMSGSPPHTPESVIRTSKLYDTLRNSGKSRAGAQELALENGNHVFDTSRSNESIIETAESEEWLESPGNHTPVDYSKDGISHFVSSAKTGEGIEQVFKYVIKRVYAGWEKENVPEVPERNIITVIEDIKEKPRKCC